MNQIDWSQCPELESVPGKVGGAWVFRDTRVPVSAILRNLGTLTAKEVAAEFPPVREEQVRAVLDFLARNADPPTSAHRASPARREPAA